MGAVEYGPGVNVGLAPRKRHARSTANALLLALALAWAAAPAFSDTIRLVGGDVVSGEILRSDSESVVLNHPVLGQLTIPRADIADSAGAPLDQTETKEGAAGSDAEEGESKKGSSDTPEGPESFKLYADKNDSHVFRTELGLDGSKGNTDEQSARLKLEYRNRKTDSFTKIDTTYYYKIKEGDRSDNKLVLQGTQIWLYKESRWFLRANARFDYDEFESWQERITAQVGPGYRFRDTEKIWLAGLTGVGLRREIGSQNDDWKLEASLGTDIIWRPSDRQTIEFDLFGWVVPDDLDDYRALATLNWRVTLSEKRKLSLVTGFSLEYQSIVDTYTLQDYLQPSFSWDSGLTFDPQRFDEPRKEKYDFRNYVGLSFQL